MRPGLATIVVPAYNVEAFVGQCIRSILAQSYADIEVLVVDDGSTDGTAAEVERAAAGDPRVRVFRNENHGVSYSRNFAIERGEGEYLLFVDADDVVAPDFVEALVGPLADGGCELSAVGIGPFQGADPEFGRGDVKIYRNNEIYKACLDICKGFVCNKGFLYYIVRCHNLKLKEDVVQSEDMLFLLDYVAHCNTLAYDDGVRYGYRQRIDSATNNLGNPKWFGVIDVYEAYEARLGDDRELAEAVRSSFLPIAYEGLWRYRHGRFDDPGIRARLGRMRSKCEEGLRSRPFPYRAKMFVYRHLMWAVELRHRAVIAR